MNRALIAGATVVACCGLIALGTGDAPAQAKKTAPGWLNSFDQAKTQARQSGKPIFLVFR